MAERKRWTKKQDNGKEREKTKTRKGNNKSAAAARAQVCAYILQQTSQQNTMQPNGRASDARNCADGKHADTIFWSPRRVPHTIVLGAYLPWWHSRPHAQIIAHTAHEKRQKRRFIH